MRSPKSLRSSLFRSKIMAGTESEADSPMPSKLTKDLKSMGATIDHSGVTKDIELGR